MQENLKKNNKKIFFIFLIILAGIIIFFINSKNKNKQQYQTAKIIREDITESVSASGQIINASSFTVITQASGIVKKVYVKNGQKIKKGDKILEVELDQQGEKNYQSALTNYLSAKNNLENVKINLYSLQAEMFNKWEIFYNLATSSIYQNVDGTPNETNRQLPEFLIAKNNWLAAEAKYKNQYNEINQAQTQLNNAWINLNLYSPTIYSPANGTISDLIYEEGMIIGINSSSTNSNSQKIASIITNSLIFGKFNVSEVDVSKIKIGQKAIITIDALPKKTFTGEITGIDKTGELNSSVVSYPVIIKFDSQTDEVLPNMSASVNIIVNRKNNVLTVPSSAIIRQEDINYLRVLKKGKIVLMPIETGITSNEKTEILSGVKEGDEIVVSIISPSNQSNSSQSLFSNFGIGGQRIRIR